MSQLDNILENLEESHKTPMSMIKKELNLRNITQA